MTAITHLGVEHLLRFLVAVFLGFVVVGFAVGRIRSSAAWRRRGRTSITGPGPFDRKGTLTMGDQEYRYRKIDDFSVWIKPKRKRWWRR